MSNHALVAGGAHSGFISPDRRIFLCGKNENGELGTKDKQQRYHPTHIPFSKRILLVSFGDYHTAIIDEEHRVWLSGENGDQCLGLPAHVESVTEFVSLQFPGDRKVVDVACGYNCTLFVCESDDLFGLGTNPLGALGSHPAVGAVSKPTLISLPAECKNMKSIRCGSFFSYIVTYSGLLFSSGINLFGQLALGDQQNRFGFTQITILDSTGSLVSFDDVQCSPEFVIALDKHGKAWTCGFNSLSQLGLGDRNDRSALQVVTFPLSSTGTQPKIISVAAGGTHSVAVTRGGDVFGWGANRFGQVAQPPAHDITTPSSIHLPTSVPACAVACGSRHTLIATRNGCVYGIGKCEFGQLGFEPTGDEEKVHEGSVFIRTPRQVQLSFALPVHDIWSPNNHHTYPDEIRDAVKCILIMSLCHPVSRAPLHPEAPFWLLPPELLFHIIQFMVQSWYQ